MCLHWTLKKLSNLTQIKFIDPILLLQQGQIKKQKHWSPDGVVKLQIRDSLCTAFKLLPRVSDYFHRIGDGTKHIFVGVFNFVPASLFKTGTGECVD